MNLREDADGVTFDVLVQPRASRPRLGPVHGDRLKISVTAPPVDGEANAAVIELVARSLGVARGAVTVTSGAASRRKTLRVLGVGAAALLGALTLVTGCGQTGTISIEPVTAPGSTLLDDVEHVRLILSNPLTILEADRGPNGFDLALEVTAEGPSGSVLLEGYDASGDLIAYGRTPPLPIAAIDAAVTIYVGAPQSLDEAPITLGTARSEIGAALLDYGVLLAGGRDADGDPTRDLVVYNAYDHELQAGADLPEARAGVAVGAGITGYAYLFGGQDADGDPRGSLWRFDTTVAPAGTYVEASEDADLARAGVTMAPLGSDAFLVTGAPPALLEGLLLRASPIETPPELTGKVASVQRLDEPGAPVYTLIVGSGAGSTGIMRFTEGRFDEQTGGPADAERTGHGVVSTVSDEIIVVGGQDATGVLGSAIRCDPAARTYQAIPDLLATPRTDAAVAATAAYLVVAGGRDAAGDLVPDAEIFDLETLTRIATIPMLVPRANALAEPLPNQQVIIVGGVDAAGAPIDTLELYTPIPPEI